MKIKLLYTKDIIACNYFGNGWYIGNKIKYFFHKLPMQIN